MDENSKVIIITANDLFLDDLASIMRDKNVDFIVIDSLTQFQDKILELEAEKILYGDSSPEPKVFINGMTERKAKKMIRSMDVLYHIKIDCEKEYRTYNHNQPAKEGIARLRRNHQYRG